MKEVCSLSPNAIIVTANVGDIVIDKLLVDNGIACDILSLNVFTRMGIDNKYLK